MQAGIAMGLAKAVAARFPSWGQDFSTLMVRASVMTTCFPGCCAWSASDICKQVIDKQHFCTGHVQIGVILFNMLSGPSLFRAAIVALGESRRRGFHDADSRTLTK